MMVWIHGDDLEVGRESTYYGLALSAYENGGGDHSFGHLGILQVWYWASSPHISPLIVVFH